MALTNSWLCPLCRLRHARLALLFRLALCSPISARRRADLNSVHARVATLAPLSLKTRPGECGPALFAVVALPGMSRLGPHAFAGRPESPSRFWSRDRKVLFMDVPHSRKDLPVFPNGRHVAGIDIGQQQHAAAGLTSTGLHFGRDVSFKNNRPGVEQLERSLLLPLGGPPKVLIGMEATGHYLMPLYF